jgi:uncharacterized protein (TIGR00251 family)
MTTAGDGQGIVLAVRVVPRAKRDELAGTVGDALKVRLRAPPVDGKANAALVEFLAELLGIPRQRVTLVCGGTSRTKRVRLQGVTAQQASCTFPGLHFGP